MMQPIRVLMLGYVCELGAVLLVSDSGSSSPSSGGSPATGRKQGPPTAPKPGMTPSKTFLTRLELEPILCKLKLKNFMKHYVSDYNCYISDADFNAYLNLAMKIVTAL